VQIFANISANLQPYAKMIENVRKSVTQVGLIDEKKTEGRKSHETVPFKGIFAAVGAIFFTFA
jgi:hypothetical protein